MKRLYLLTPDGFSAKMTELRRPSGNGTERDEEGIQTIHLFKSLNNIDYGKQRKHYPASRQGDR